MTSESKQRHRDGILGAVDNERFSRNVDATLLMFAELDIEKFADTICNVAKIHAELFNKTNEDERAIGITRNRDMRVMYLSEGRVLSEARMAPVSKIGLHTAIYEVFIRKICTERPNADVASAYLAAAMHAFFVAHPFSDGNGRVMRFIVRALCSKLGYNLSSRWTIDERPYNRHFNYAIRHYPNAPFLLVGALREFFEPVTRPEVAPEKRVNTKSIYGAFITEEEAAPVVAFSGAGWKAYNCRDMCDGFDSPVHAAQCMRDCMANDDDGGPGDPDDGQSYLDWLTSILDRS